MKIYDEITHELIENPDLKAGQLYDGVIVVGHEPERIEVMEGTVTAARPAGLRRRIPAHDITEPCQYYHKYTEAELAAMHPPDEPQPSDTAATWDELAAAYTEGVKMA
ncbi:hypothetical protein [uncultured Subdoligranulum sp.]|uniref:hypothetical protein n=1 Tax=uncultured Subdoligranulum sp. TaxID=512298 RepID=UPI00261B482F|nr:hypothetical protein [uncultured Subdoligranulum sp.]